VRRSEPIVNLQTLGGSPAQHPSASSEGARLLHPGGAGSGNPWSDEVDQVRYGVDDLGGAEGVAVDVVGLGDAGQHQEGAHPGLQAGQDVGVHAVADHRGGLRVGAYRVEPGPHHQRVGLADEVRLLAGGGGDQGGDRAGGGQIALGGGADVVGVGGDE